jgi:mRNA-degrading endonuclease RelE of RelBE toxin-antitoxin system
MLKALERRLERLSPTQRQQFAEWLEILAQDEISTPKDKHPS